ncbi:glycosyltransferase family protein [Gluconobacter sp. R75690]|uniref:tetratricopeptide repeat-containing glycosyltransferase family protein n=1 Tax=Gluconobacter TaxID=441 RepID=UPI00188A41AA|nr:MULTISPECIES: tetratricopeptide repeat-containing glycosyltransferase family protein [unclassified Gluconobacter]MBF0851844.1 glycosyltransferase family protein [Gluconobacter sp. R75690]MBF0880399.1 glycosyltransferase family protein [Gluconobacter sp. R75828]
MPNSFRLLAQDILALGDAGDIPGALEKLHEGVQTLPQDPHSAFLAGCLYERFKDWNQARHFYLQSLHLEINAPRIWHRLGIVCLEAGDLDGAEQALKVAIQQKPEEAPYYVDLSLVQARKGLFEEALENAVTGDGLCPDHVPAINNIAHALQCLGRSEESLPYYDRTVALAPENGVCRFGRAVSLLKVGNFKDGWREYEWRWRCCQTPRTDLLMPQWEGEDLRGKTILIHHEQGYGDTLQFIRFMPLLKARGATVVVQIPIPLVRLLERVEGIDRIVSVLDPSLHLDLHCPLVGVPLRLNLTPSSAPGCPYLSVSEEEQIRQGGALRHSTLKDVQRPELIVGLVWNGDPRPHDRVASQVDRRRSVPLEKLASLMDVEGIRFVSFQLGTPKNQIAETGLPVIDATDGITDFADTAARLYGVDLLISVDTSIVHLAGGLGLPVWMVSRSDACWRWGETGATTPWYPSMRIFRQPRSGDWETPVAEIADLLRQFVALYRMNLETEAA